MSMEERTFKRNLLYSQWHRSANISRFLPQEVADSLGMIDIDAAEYCRDCYVTFALIETQVSHNPPKSARVTQKLAEDAGKLAYSVSIVPNAAGDDIELFRVRRIQPYRDTVWEMSPQVYAEFLVALRADHRCESRLALVA